MAKPNDEMMLPSQLPDFAKWEEEQTGFAPYWNPEEAAWIFAQVISKEDSAETFTRYLLRAGVDTKCKRGPAEDAEDVLVKKGEYFTISVYHALQGLFDFYLESNFRPFVRIESVKKSKTSEAGRMVWNWKVLSSPEARRKMNELRALKASQSDGGEFPPGEDKKQLNASS